jgi:EF hand
MIDVSRTMLARSLVVLTTSAGIFLTGSSFAQTSATQPSAPAAQAAPGSPSGTPHGSSGMRHGQRGDHGARHLKQMDTDGDGAISRAEYDAVGQKMNERRAKFFEMADANKDGKLSTEEMKAFRDSHRRGAHSHPHGGAAQPGQPANHAPK